LVFWREECPVDFEGEDWYGHVVVDGGWGEVVNEWIDVGGRG